MTRIHPQILDTLKSLLGAVLAALHHGSGEVKEFVVREDGKGGDAMEVRAAHCGEALLGLVQLLQEEQSTSAQKLSEERNRHKSKSLLIVELQVETRKSRNISCWVYWYRYLHFDQFGIQLKCMLAVYDCFFVPAQEPDEIR